MFTLVYALSNEFNLRFENRENGNNVCFFVSFLNSFFPPYFEEKTPTYLSLCRKTIT